MTKKSPILLDESPESQSTTAQTGTESNTDQPPHTPNIRETLEARVAQLTQERDEYVKQATSNVSFLNGRLEEVQNVLEIVKAAEAGQ